MLNLSMFKHAALAAALLMPACFAYAHQYKIADIEIAHPWSQELPPNAPTVAAYFVIHNAGSTADRLLGVDTPIAESAQLHQHLMEGDVMKMQPVASVEVPPGGTVTFAPMAYHVMLVGLKDRSLLQDGKHFPMTLHFEKAGAITVDVNVQKQAPPDSMEAMHTH